MEDDDDDILLTEDDAEDNVEEQSSQNEVVLEEKEELSKDEESEESEAEQYSKKVQNRIAKLTSRYHEEKRARERYESDLSEYDKLVKQLAEENNKYREVITNGEKVMIGEAKGRLDSEFKNAQAALVAALEGGEATAIATAQAELARVAAQQERLKGYTPQPLPKVEPPTVRRQEQPPQPDPRAVDWAKKNRWFGRDREMTEYAMVLHRKLVEDDGITPDSEDYYSELNATIKRRFPEKFEREPQAASKPRSASVAPATRTGVRPRRVTLTESQVRIAKRLGLTPEQYAAEMVKVNVE